MSRSPTPTPGFFDSSYSGGHDPRRPLLRGGARSDQSSEVLAVATQELSSGKYKITAITFKGIVSVVASTPAALMAFLGSLNVNIGDLDSFSELSDLVKSKSQSEKTQAWLHGSSSLIVNTGVNFIYLPEALGKFATLINKIIGRGSDDDKLSNVDVAALLWAFATSFGPAAMAKQTLSFGKAFGLDWIGFFINFVVYFATRSKGIRAVLGKAIDPEEKGKFQLQQHIAYCALVKSQHVSSDEVDPEQAIVDALAKFLSANVDCHEQPDGKLELVSEPSKVKSILSKMNGLPPALVILLVMGVETYEGFAALIKLFGGELPEMTGMTKPAGWTVAGISSLIGSPTSLFYYMSGGALVDELITTYKQLKDYYDSSEYTKLASWSFVSAALLYFNYASSFGVAGIARTKIAQYIGKQAVSAWWAKAAIFISGWGAFNANAKPSFEIINNIIAKPKLEDITDIDRVTFLQIIRYYPELYGRAYAQYKQGLDISTDSESASTSSEHPNP